MDDYVQRDGGPSVVGHPFGNSRLGDGGDFIILRETIWSIRHWDMEELIVVEPTFFGILLVEFILLGAL